MTEVWQDWLPVSKQLIKQVYLIDNPNDECLILFEIFLSSSMFQARGPKCPHATWIFLV